MAFCPWLTANIAMILSSRPLRVAVIGNPIAHSKSPAIHQAFAKQTGIDLSYERIEAPLDRFAKTVSDFFAESGKGLNVTVPFKQEAWQLAAHLNERATQAQAVNTLWMKDGALHGGNTDGLGLVNDLTRLHVVLRGANILLVGAGGAARGVIGPLLDAGCQTLHVVNRTRQKALELVESWRHDGSSTLTSGGLHEAARPGGWDLVINASSSSLGDSPPDLPKGLYAPGALAYDMMYGPKPTPFMHQAQLDGASAVADGLGMLVGQAAESFMIWHGVRPDIAPVLSKLRHEMQV
jgi:shikimate dehydrogenase